MRFQSSYMKGDLKGNFKGDFSCRRRSQTLKETLKDKGNSNSQGLLSATVKFHFDLQRLVNLPKGDFKIFKNSSLLSSKCDTALNVFLVFLFVFCFLLWAASSNNPMRSWVNGGSGSSRKNNFNKPTAQCGSGKLKLSWLSIARRNSFICVNGAETR